MSDDPAIKFVPWDILEVRDRKNHTEAKVPSHPRATNGWMSYPKVVMENHLERRLLPTEIVFHLDGDPFNNSVENLEVISQSELISRMRERGKGTVEKKRQAREEKRQAEIAE